MIRAILLGLLCALLALPATLGAAGSALGATTVVICTGSGLTTITLDPSGDPAPEAAPDAPCLWQAAAALPSAPGSASLAPGVRAATAPPPRSLPTTPRRHLRRPARGPPLPV